MTRAIACEPKRPRLGNVRTESLRKFVATMLVTLVLALAVMWTPLSYAIGPTLPIRFLDFPHFKDPWAVQLLVDAQRARVLRIQRLIYVDGERVLTEEIEVKYDRQANRDTVDLSAQVPLRVKAIEQYSKRRTLTEQLIVEGQWIKQNASKPIVIQRWFYFLARAGKFERVDMETYSNLTDRAETNIDSLGKLGLVQAGRDVKGSTPLSETKKSFAVPLGRLGGAAEENVPSYRKPTQPQDDHKERKQN